MSKYAAKWKCERHRCSWIGGDDEYLRAPSPFDPADELIACPKCKEVNSLRGACDEPGCAEFASGGTPTPDGYRWTCYKHYPKDAA